MHLVCLLPMSQEMQVEADDGVVEVREVLLGYGVGVWVS